MELKTKINALDGKQEVFITREFDLPLDLLFKAFSEPEIIEQWMGTNVVKLENKNHGGWQFETKDASGNVVFRANGVIHEFNPERKITRTFEMENTSFGVQLEFMEFEKVNEETSKINMQIVYRSNADRDLMLQRGMGKGMNMAHNRLEEIARKLKK